MPTRFEIDKGHFGSPAVVKAADNRLRRSPYPRVARVSCEYDRGVLLLRGRVSSYYQKQLAQETLRDLEGVVEIVNEIEVAG